MTFRLLGLPEEDRLAIEEASGGTITTEAARLIIEKSVQEAEALLNSSIREVQEVIGPHGSVTRLQAGGVRITSGGISVYEDGVLKTTVKSSGDLLVGSDITDPATTTFICFVNEQTYNNEAMGAGDLLIGDNTTGNANVKYDASEGQLQFRGGTTVQVYIDTDGTLKAGEGGVTLDTNGITLLNQSGQIRFRNAANTSNVARILAQSDDFFWIIGDGVGKKIMITQLMGDGVSLARLTLSGDGFIVNSATNDVDTVMYGEDGAASVFILDAGLNAIGIGGAAESGYKLKVTGDIKSTTAVRVGDDDVRAYVCEGRLTLASGTPVTTADQTAKTTVYFTPYKGNRISLYESSKWNVYEFSEISTGLGPSTNTNVDVFIFNNSGTLTLSQSTWTNDTTRADALTTQDGVLVKSGDTGKRYLGTYRANASAQTEDSRTDRFLWNYYNRVKKPLHYSKATSSWTYGTTTWRQANADANAEVEIVVGWLEDEISLKLITSCTVSGSSVYGYVAIGEDSTTAPAADAHYQGGGGLATGWFIIPSTLDAYPSSVGYHYYAWLELANATVTFYAGSGADNWRGGFNGSWFC